jgi:5,10-methylenetetrahydromethanopterin reductase
MKFGLRMPACVPIDQLAAAVERAEQGGYDYAWIQDTQLLEREVWAALGAAALRTSRIILGPNVTNPITRHASVTASAAATLDEVTGGRFMLGLGAGDSALRVMGRRVARLSEIRDCVALMRELWTGGFVERDDARFRLQFGSGRQIPIYLAATGPNMLQLAGEIADGVILQGGVARESIEYARELVERGAGRVERSAAEIDFVVVAFCYVGNDWRARRKLMQPMAGMFAIRSSESLRAAGIEVPDPGDVSELYPDLLHAEDWERAIELTEWVPTDVLELFCERYCLMGTADEVAARVKTLASFGVSTLYVRDHQTFALPTDVSQAFVAQVMPRFGRPTSGPDQA